MDLAWHEPPRTTCDPLGRGPIARDPVLDGPPIVFGDASSDVVLLAGWYGDAARIVEHLDAPELPAILDAALGRLVPFDLSVIFAYPTGRKPLYLYDGFGTHVPGPSLERYLSGAYLLDPFYTACSRGLAPGLYRMRELAPDAFFEGSYVGNAEVHPCISMQSGSLAEEIGYVVELKGGLRATYSLMRSNGSLPFSESEFERLRRIEPIVRQALSRHFRPMLVEPPAALAAHDRGEILEAAFASFGADVLSLRERTVAQMILRGHSAHSIAATLEIAEGTVKNHRKSIYAKLAIASQQELFGLFLAHVLARPG